MKSSLATCSSYLLTVSMLMAGSMSHAAEDIRTERVHFKKGTSGAVVEGTVKGYQVVDYVLNAREGQQMQASLATKNTATYFNILAPGETEQAMFNGSMDENQYEGILPKSGDYKVRVYMMRSAARRNEVAPYRLEININAVASTSEAPSNDALVPGTEFHATGSIPCSMTRGQPTGTCDFGVVRSGNGGGTVTISKGDGGQRVIFFENGNATGYDQSQADTGKFSASKEADLSIIRIGDERYEIPDAVVFGG